MMLIDAEDAASPVHKMLISLNKPKVSKTCFLKKHLLDHVKNSTILKILMYDP